MNDPQYLYAIDQRKINDQNLFKVRYLESEIVGGPGWINSLRFDVEGRPDARTVPFPYPQIQAMLRSLLEDRFGLKTHTERRDAPVYHFVLARERSSLKVSTQPPERRTAMIKAEAAGSIAAGTAAPVSSLVGLIQMSTTRRIFDRTGLTGAYDYELKFSPERTAVAAVTTDGAFPVIFTALQEQLGLKLESARGQVEVLVIDSARMPEEN